MSYPTQHLTQTLENTRAHLRALGALEPLAQTPPGSLSTGFLCRLTADGREFHLKLRLEEKLGLALCQLYLPITIPPQRREQAALFCMECTARVKAGAVLLDPETGAVFAHAEASFRDGPLSQDTLAYLEQILLSLLLPNYTALARFA